MVEHVDSKKEQNLDLVLTHYVEGQSFLNIFKSSFKNVSSLI